MKRLQRKNRDGTLYLSDETGVVLSLKEVVSGTLAEITLSGDLRSIAEHELLDELLAFQIIGLDLKLDFSGVTNISPACMQVLLTVQLAMDKMGSGSLTLVKVPPAIYEALASTGLSELLLIEDM